MRDHAPELLKSICNLHLAGSHDYSPRSGKIWNVRLNWKYWHRRHQFRIPMKHHTSRLKIFDSGSMSDCTPQARGIRVTERIPSYFKRWFPTQHSSQPKVSVENVTSYYGLGDLWRLLAGNPEPVGVVNPSNAAGNSTSPCTPDFTGRVPIL